MCFYMFLPLLILSYLSMNMLFKYIHRQLNHSKFEQVKNTSVFLTGIYLLKPSPFLLFFVSYISLPPFFPSFFPKQKKTIDPLLFFSPSKKTSRWGLNHPSIMAWAFFNEGPSDDVRSCPGYEACVELLRRDPTRFVTWASNRKLWLFLKKNHCLRGGKILLFSR